MQTIADISKPVGRDEAEAQVPFGVNEMRLSGREWVVVIAIVVVVAVVLPRVWKRVERFAPGADYRVPYSLSRDYWLYERRVEMESGADRILVVGDSVVWGEYVRADGTLSHFLNEQSGQSDRFVNCGVNGMFPLALEGLMRDYGAAVRGRKVLLHCNMLWMSSPKADLSIDREQMFNHSRLVPQFSVRIPCYRADANERMSAVLERNVGMFSWVNHLQTAYYDQKSLASWTLEDDGRDPPGYPNTWRSPIAPLRGGIPGEPVEDPARGPSSVRHKPWNVGGAETTRFEWVDLDASLQWKAFERLVGLLRERGNDVLVVVGPFNEHTIAEDQRAGYRGLRDEIAARLEREGVTRIVPEALDSKLYADASHPLTEGYSALARAIGRESAFRKWVGRTGADLGHGR